MSTRCKTRKCSGKSGCCRPNKCIVSRKIPKSIPVVAHASMRGGVHNYVNEDTDSLFPHLDDSTTLSLAAGGINRMVDAPVTDTSVTNTPGVNGNQGFIVTGNNNIIPVGINNYIVPIGNYETVEEFVQVVGDAIDPGTITYDSNTMKFTLSWGDQEVISWSDPGTMWELLGFNNEDTADLSVHISPNEVSPNGVVRVTEARQCYLYCQSDRSNGGFWTSFEEIRVQEYTVISDSTVEIIPLNDLEPETVEICAPILSGELSTPDPITGVITYTASGPLGSYNFMYKAVKKCGPIMYVKVYILVDDESVNFIRSMGNNVNVTMVRGTTKVIDIIENDYIPNAGEFVHETIELVEGGDLRDQPSEGTSVDPYILKSGASIQTKLVGKGLVQIHASYIKGIEIVKYQYEITGSTVDDSNSAWIIIKTV